MAGKWLVNFAMWVNLIELKKISVSEGRNTVSATMAEVPVDTLRWWSRHASLVDFNKLCSTKGTRR